VLEMFLEAVKGMGDFCSDAQLKEMDLLSQSARAQWEVRVVYLFLNHWYILTLGEPAGSLGGQ